MSEHDFKAALDAFGKGFKNGAEFVDWWDDHREACLKALRIADKLVQEPQYTSEVYNSIFKAMRDQLIKEISE